MPEMAMKAIKDPVGWYDSRAEAIELFEAAIKIHFLN
jgi:hypothetical protein